MSPIRLRFMGEECHDAIVEHFFRAAPWRLCREDADAFFGALCLIIDREIARVVSESRVVSPPSQGRGENGRADATPGGAQDNTRQT